MNDPKSNLPEPPAAEEIPEEPQDEVATAMALAFENARVKNSRKDSSKNTKKRSSQTSEIDDIIKRTLRGQTN